MNNHRPVRKVGTKSATAHDETAVNHWHTPEGAIDREFLARLADRATPSTLAQMFDGFTPNWAVESMGRCLLAELLTRDPQGVLALTGTGREQATRGQFDAVAFAKKLTDADSQARKSARADDRYRREGQRW